jgi:hypothetical protein
MKEAEYREAYAKYVGAEGLLEPEDLIKAGMDANIVRTSENRSQAAIAGMSLPGVLGISPLLEKRRIEYQIPDGAFASRCVYNVLFVFQIAEQKGETMGTGSIVMPGTVKARETAETPRGVIVGAGLKALDELRSNGIDLGHVIRFIQNAPFHIRTDVINGFLFNVYVLRSGDVVSSDDLESTIRSGQLKVDFDAKLEQHILIDKNGNQLGTPRLPWIDPAF